MAQSGHTFLHRKCPLMTKADIRQVTWAYPSEFAKAAFPIAMGDGARRCHKSSTLIPAIIAMTKTSTRGDRLARFSMPVPDISQRGPSQSRKAQSQ
jgi:hypothetical protein